MRKFRLLDRKSLTLIVLVLISGISIIFFNFYVIKTTASIRGYINGESNYSKGQKDAVRSLLQYLDTESNADWEAYKKI